MDVVSAKHLLYRFVYQFHYLQIVFGYFIKTGLWIHRCIVIIKKIRRNEWETCLNVNKLKFMSECTLWNGGFSSNWFIEFTSEQALMVWRRFAWLVDDSHFGKIITKIICIQFMLDVRFEWCADFLFCQFHPIDAFEETMRFYLIRSGWASTCQKYGIASNLIGLVLFEVRIVYIRGVRTTISLTKSFGWIFIQQSCNQIAGIFTNDFGHWWTCF